MGLPDMLSAMILVYWLTMLALALPGLKRIRLLPRSAKPAADSSLPLVSVIIAAKEEEATIADTVRQILNQDYPRMEIIAVNDRSTDGTGRQLEQLKLWSERRPDTRIPLRVVHVTTLPDGWLGKNNALYQGYLQARGSLLLFTDADVRFSRSAIRDAVAAMQAERADHLTLAPSITAPSYWLRAFIHYFLFSLMLYLRMWRANDDDQHRFGAGIGAFNLISRKAYETIGTHRALALRPDDDLRLGLLVKQRRFRQRLLSGKHHLQVEWYPSLQEAAKGLEKNMFSGFGYRLSLAAFGLIGQLLAFLGPFAGLLLLPRWSGFTSAASAALLVYLYVLCTRRLSSDSGQDAWLLPASILGLVLVLARAVGLTLRRGGIVWRGTFYPLSRLRGK